MRRIRELIVFTIAAVVVAQATTFGWRFGRRTASVLKDPSLAESLKNHVYVLSHEIGDRNIFAYRMLQKSAAYIAAQFASFGYGVEFQEYAFEGKSFKNIIAAKQGAQKPDEVIVIGAHYDTCLNVGADDNASGIAALLELARHFTRQANARTIKFVAFVNEEPPFFETEWTGSRIYAKAAKAKNEDIKATLIFEMLGYFSHRPFSQKYPPLLGPFLPNRGDFIAVVGNFPSFGLVRHISRLFRKQGAFPLEAVVLPSWAPGVTFSDHYAFWQQGYPAVMFTDTAFYRNPHYHKNSDTFQTLDYNHMAAFVDALKPVITALADPDML